MNTAATTTIILLGNYNQSMTTIPFYLYTINNTNYYCIDDINILFLNGKLNEKADLILQLFKSNSNDFIKDKKTAKIFIMTRTIIQIARLFNMYCLAELCKLSNQEILGNVAEPLLNNISDYDWSIENEFVVVERNLFLFESLYGNEWLFIASPFTSTESDTCLSTKIKLPPTPKSLPRNKKALLYQWLSSNINNDPSMIQTLISAAKVKKQQQAIIETRQRQAAFIIPTTKLANKSVINKKQKISRGASANTLKHPQKNIAGTIHHNTTKSFPPSPPFINNNTTSTMTVTTNTRKRKHQNEEQNTENKRSTSYQQFIINHGNDNLNLLATQATQMRGLPLSPEVSPSPPPFYHSHHQQRLPSIQVMLSELNNHHRHQSSSSRV